MTYTARFLAFLAVSLVLVVAYQVALAAAYNASDSFLFGYRIALHYGVPVLLTLAISLLFGLWRSQFPWQGKL